MAQLNNLIVTGAGRFLNTIQGNISGNAATAGSATVASNIVITATNPSSNTSYNIPFAASTGNQSLLSNDGLLFTSSQGTTSTLGTSAVILGNGTPKGTAGNKVGWLCLYGEWGGYAQLGYVGLATSGVTTHYLPTTGGTILNSGTTSFTSSVAYGPKIGTLKINGTDMSVLAPMMISLMAQALQIDLISMTTLTANTYINNTNGQATTYNGWMASDYIKITSNTTYEYIHRIAANQWAGCPSVYYAFYNSSKTYTHGGYTTSTNYSLVSTANDVYVRVSAANSDINGANDSMFGVKSYLDNIINK